MDYALENYSSFIGKPISELPTPSFVISLPVLKQNIANLHRDVEKLGISFRPHVKTLKTIEVTRLMLAGGKYRSIVASTLPEIRGVLPLVKEGILDECLYGLPIYPSVLPRLAELRKSLRILLMVDNEQQIAHLEQFGAEAPWDIFIKLDIGSHRAGIEIQSSALHSLVERAEASSAVHIYGFYCHAGHSYAGRSQNEAENILNVEISSVLEGAKLLPDRKLVVSIGSTPTAHVAATLKTAVPANIKIELHAGNFPCNDLQQVSTGLVNEAAQATYVVAEVCSIYPDRNEALVNAGVISMSREPSAFAGFGQVVGQPAWRVMRMSQEHGILGTEEKDKAVGEAFRVGQQVDLYCNHACITAAAFFVYFVADESNVICEAWVPWKGW
ncbi:putative serine dehydratase domain-containing protein [Dactylonectria estremocensis]|uniref:D-serine dehydratase n=1 Tax=Dactylonectria estremocensis TaxID=1079267 RepID=A0A9P9EFT1_9HYPO|nr:putative serine dehydratase domain-containing protein [Dactylonectria estremocensis]